MSLKGYHEFKRFGPAAGKHGSHGKVFGVVAICMELSSHQLYVIHLSPHQ